jgi:hypothetical protein
MAIAAALLPAPSTARAARLTRHEPAGQPAGEPFHSAEQAWFWTMAALVARHEGRARSAAAIRRNCEPDDVIRCLDTLYRSHRITLAHARILRLWGERQTAPDPSYDSERTEWQVWHDALQRLEWLLRMKGIIA